MAIIKIKKHDNPYVIIDKTCFNDPNLSWKAKGLHGYLMGLPADWEIRVADLIKRATDQRDSVYNALKELMAAGYLTAHRGRNAKGHYQGLAYDVHETPQKPNASSDLDEMTPAATTSGKSGSGQLPLAPSTPPHPDFPDTVNPDRVFPEAVEPDAEKPPLLIKDITNNPVTKNPAAIGQAAMEGLTAETNATEISAAAFSSTELLGEANRIGATLTETQSALITGCVQSICQAKPELEPEQLQAEITYVLLSPKSFTGAGQDFMQKLNTIIKIIRQGRWTRPAGLKTPAEEAAETRQAQVKQLQQTLTELAAERAHWKTLLDLAQEKNLDAFVCQNYENFFQQSNHRFNQIQSQLQQLKNGA